MKLWRRSKCGEIKCVKKQLRSEEHLRLFIARWPALHSFRLNKVQLQHPRGSGLIKRASEGFILRPTVSKHDVNVSNYTRGLETRSDRLITFTRVWWRVDAAAELKREFILTRTPAFYPSASHVWRVCLHPRPGLTGHRGATSHKHKRCEIAITLTNTRSFRTCSMKFFNTAE